VSVKAMSWVFEHSRSALADRLVLLAIADHANNDGLDAWPSVATIARKARVGRSTAFRSIERLVELGEITVESGGGRGRRNCYQLLMERSQNDTVTNGPRLRPPPAETVQPTVVNGPTYEPETVQDCDPNLKKNNYEHAGAHASRLQSVRECLANATPTTPKKAAK
jgi:hypothetical protein